MNSEFRNMDQIVDSHSPQFRGASNAPDAYQVGSYGGHVMQDY